MAMLTFANLMSLGKARVSLSGSFQPNGAATTVSNVKGRGFTVAHTAGANSYTVTLSDPYMDYDCVQLQIQSATLGQQVQLLSEPTVSTTKQFVIGLLDSGSKAAVNDAAFNANLRIHFTVVLKNSSLGANY